MFWIMLAHDWKQLSLQPQFHNIWNIQRETENTDKESQVLIAKTRLGMMLLLQCCVGDLQLLFSMSCFGKRFVVLMPKLLREFHININKLKKNIMSAIICSQIQFNHEDYLLSFDPYGCSGGYTHCGVLRWG